MLTEKVTLTRGVEYDGKRHTEVVLRAAIVRDSVDAEKEADGKGLLFLALCMIRKMIVEFGDIPKEKITVDLLLQLNDEDFERLNTVREYLKKKALWSSAD